MDTLTKQQAWKGPQKLEEIKYRELDSNGKTYQQFNQSWRKFLILTSWNAQNDYILLLWRAPEWRISIDY